MKATIFFVVLQLINTSLGNTIHPDSIVIHHSALTRQDVLQHPGPVTAQTIDALHEKRGFNAFYWGKSYHIGYHYLILPNGLIQGGRPERCIGSHTRGHNRAIGICLVGNFSSREDPQEEPGNLQPSEAQMRALESLIRDVAGRYNISCDKIYRHDDLNPKTQCPGDRFPWKNLRTRIGCGEQK
jgi:hypothetical protein